MHFWRVPRCAGLLGLPQQNTARRAASTTEMYFLTLLEVRAGSASSQASLVGFLLPLPVAVPRHTLVPGVPAVSSSFYKDTTLIRLGPTLMGLIEPSHLFKGPVSKYGYIQRYWGLPYLCDFGIRGHNSAHHTR